MAEPESETKRWPGSQLWQPVPSFAPPPPEAVGQLEALWQDLDGQLAEAQAACRACGECCDFPRRGHILFATKLELDICLSWACDQAVVAEAAARGRLAGWQCPFLEGGRCAVRPARPVGCRLFFCHSPEAVLSEEIAVAAHHRLRSITMGHIGLRWYGPALAYLETNISRLRSGG
jgi:Fe-S-cluster containining protein